MTTFDDGPAKGKHLNLRRAVHFLRVVKAPNGDIDALDQLGDTARPEETIYAYEISEAPSWCHIRSGKKGASGFYAIARYHLFKDQPTDEVMRDNNAWSDWCHKHGDART